MECRTPPVATAVIVVRFTVHRKTPVRRDALFVQLFYSRERGLGSWKNLHGLGYGYAGHIGRRPATAQLGGE